MIKEKGERKMSVLQQLIKELRECIKACEHCSGGYVPVVDEEGMTLEEPCVRCDGRGWYISEEGLEFLAVLGKLGIK